MPAADDDPLCAVYGDLLGLARHYLSDQRRDHTLQPTALANETFLRLVDQTWPADTNRRQLLCLAARAMRCVLVDHARRRGAKKRGGGNGKRVPMDDTIALYEQRAFDLLGLDEALARLAAEDPQAVQIIELRFFGGLNEREIAAILGCSVRTVRRDWQTARCWLKRELQRDLE